MQPTFMVIPLEASSDIGRSAFDEIYQNNTKLFEKRAEQIRKKAVAISDCIQDILGDS
jgi:hypothetical protein